MARITVRCHPCVPVAIDDLRAWIGDRLEALGIDAAGGSIRVSRLSQNLPSGEVGVGWLVELEVPEHELGSAWERLARTVADMWLLGLGPTVLLPSAPRLRRLGRGDAAAPDSDAAARAVCGTRGAGAVSPPPARVGA